MKPGASIVIERSLNGFIVRPDLRAGEGIPSAGVAVFQEVGIATTSMDNQRVIETLLGFIANHFDKPNN